MQAGGFNEAASIHRSLDVDENLETLSSEKAVLLGGIILNLAASVRYLKVYDSAAAVLGTTTPKLTIPIPTQGDTNGAGMVLPIPQCGVAFENGIQIAAVEELADNGTTGAGANEVVVNLFYRAG